MEKNILIVTTTSDFLVKFERENVRILRELGYTVHYAANTREPHYFSEEQEIRSWGVRIHHIDIARSPYMLHYNRAAFLELAEIVEQYDIQIIHCHTPVGGVLGRLVGRKFFRKGVRVIYTAHGFHFYKGAPFLNNSVYYMAERFLARYTDALIVINEEDYRRAKTFRLRRKGSLYKIPGVGLHMEEFAPLKEEVRQRRREEMGIRKDDFFLVSVGELNENKNQRTVLLALEKLKKEGKLNGIKYGICGDGFYWARMERWIRELGLQENVFLYGFHLDVREILGSADVSVFPSRREGLGMAGLEALSMGIPLIASGNRGTREYMKEGENGRVFRYDDVDGLARIILEMKKMPEEERAKMSRACRESVRKFDRKYTNEIMRRVYEDVGSRVRWEKWNE